MLTIYLYTTMKHTLHFKFYNSPIRGNARRPVPWSHLIFFSKSSGMNMRDEHDSWSFIGMNMRDEHDSWSFIMYIFLFLDNFLMINHKL
jgi:hypothetical protein